MNAGGGAWRYAGPAFRLALAIGWGASVARGEPRLYEGAGGWAAVSGLPETAPPPAPDWRHEDGVWIGRVPADAQELKWGDWVLPVAEALPLPLAPARLSPTSNPFGPCVVRSLSVRYDAMVRSRPWSLVFTPEGEAGQFVPLELSGGREVEIALALEDAVSGQRWTLLPERMGREGSIFTGPTGKARFYAGTIDAGDLDWNLVVMLEKGGRYVLQGRVMAMNSPNRFLRLRVMLRTGAKGVPAVQAELPPAVVAVDEGLAVALYPDLAEPRRFRAVDDQPDTAGLEFDLAATKATGNFPRSATYSLAVESWEASGLEAALSAAVERMARAGGSVELPEGVRQDGLRAMAAFEPSRTRLSHPGGFLDSSDVMQYLLLETSGLFSNREWAASAFLCAAQDAQGGTRIERQADSALVAVNADPDLETMLEMGPNRGRTVLEDIRRRGTPAVWLKAAGASPGLDYNLRSLYLCDYPALWEDGSPAPGVDLRHAETELFSALSCVLREAGICLLVSDPGPLAPFTTYHADALVCESADLAEMRRQRALAGPRPVLWLAEAPGTEAEELARNLGFVRPGKIEEN